jgi:hypothetical protein
MTDIAAARARIAAASIPRDGGSGGGSPSALAREGFSVQRRYSADGAAVAAAALAAAAARRGGALAMPAAAAADDDDTPAGWQDPTRSRTSTAALEATTDRLDADAAALTAALARLRAQAAVLDAKIATREAASRRDDFNVSLQDLDESDEGSDDDAAAEDGVYGGALGDYESRRLGLGAPAPAPPNLFDLGDAGTADAYSEDFEDDADADVDADEASPLVRATFGWARGGLSPSAASGAFDYYESVEASTTSIPSVSALESADFETRRSRARVDPPASRPSATASAGVTARTAVPVWAADDDDVGGGLRGDDEEDDDDDDENDNAATDDDEDDPLLSNALAAAAARASSRRSTSASAASSGGGASGAAAAALAASRSPTDALAALRSRHTQELRSFAVARRAALPPRPWSAAPRRRGPLPARAVDCGETAFEENLL